MQSVTEYFTKMFVFNARATRKQFWIPYFATIVISALLAWATGAYKYFDANYVFHYQLTTGATIWLIYAIIVWIANFTMRARRLHDTNRSNWWILIAIVPLIGQIWLFVLFLLPSKADTRWPVNQSDAH
ncbi:DUF805 domain-containing protein [Schleiferilactobacillus harbinensis]|uniref:DUF805 domain-containing protein n=1 Tax=Schleiferilactobacillus harbinensis TaxID=304207 RepID=UPI00345EC46E